MATVSECLQTLSKSNLEVVIPGFTAKEAGEAFCYACRFDKSFSEGITKELVTKMLTPLWPQSTRKSVEGGLQHMVSVDNGAYYAELWYQGGNWYAVTGANLTKSTDKVIYYQIPGINKGMRLTDAVPRFCEAVFGPASLAKAEAKPCNCGK